MSPFNEEHPQWKGESVGYSALHVWVRSRMSLPKFCPTCGKDKKLELSNINYIYDRDLANWIMECRKCNSRRDADRRMRLGINKSQYYIKCPVCKKEFYSWKNKWETCSLPCRDELKRRRYTICKRGHLKVESVKTDSKGRKVCIECRRIRQAEFYKNHPRKKVRV